MSSPICCMCGISAHHRSYVTAGLLSSEDKLLISNILTSEVYARFDDSFNVCAICLEKVNGIFKSIKEMRKKCIITLTLLKTYLENYSETKWSVFRKSSIENHHLKNKLPNDNEAVEMCKQSEKDPVGYASKCDNTSSDDHFTDIEWLSDSEDITLLEKNISLENNVSEKPSISNFDKNKDHILNPIIRVNKRGYIYTTNSLDHIYKDENGHFVCLFCKSTFKYQHKAEIHTRSKHTHERPFECQHCYKSFSASHDLRRHILNVHEERKFMCSMCEKSFSRRYELIFHEKTHTTIPNVACSNEMCDKKFYDELSMKKHFTNSHTEKQYVCDQCGKNFRRRYAFVIHQRRAHSNKAEQTSAKS